ncbi:hypothetical protein [Streptomyces sp. NPDC059262]|uniref:hypothetical protein n=1 Tax=Streptomyces sp. NPDC059262 TaxID=3346797 RepID=UPI0036CB757C
MRLVPLPDGIAADQAAAHALQHAIADRHACATSVTTCRGRGFLRLPAHLYNTPADYQDSPTAATCCTPDAPGRAPPHPHRDAMTRRKTIEATIAEAGAGTTRLTRALGPLQMTLMGIGVTVGAGIFVLTGTAAARYAGPGIVLSVSTPAGAKPDGSWSLPLEDPVHGGGGGLSAVKPSASHE